MCPQPTRDEDRSSRYLKWKQSMNWNAADRPKKRTCWNWAKAWRAYYRGSFTGVNFGISITERIWAYKSKCLEIVHHACKKSVCAIHVSNLVRGMDVRTNECQKTAQMMSFFRSTVCFSPHWKLEVEVEDIILSAHYMLGNSRYFLFGHTFNFSCNTGPWSMPLPARSKGTTLLNTNCRAPARYNFSMVLK